MESPSRRRFQIHLSTAIVLMFVAGGFIWANVRERRLEIEGIEINQIFYPKWYGFPFTAASTSRSDEIDEIACAKAIAERLSDFKSSSEDDETRATSAEYLGLLSAYGTIPELIGHLQPERKEPDIVVRSVNYALVCMTQKKFGALGYKKWIEWWNGNKVEFLKQKEPALILFYKSIVFNCAFALILLFATSLFCEYLIRRTAAPKAP